MSFLHNHHLVIHQLTGHFLIMVTSALWKRETALAKTHCCHLVLLDKHCLSLIPCLFVSKTLSFGERGKIEREKRRERGRERMKERERGRGKERRIGYFIGNLSN